MSSLTQTVLMAALLLLHVYLYIYLDRVRKERQDQIVAGVIQGVAIPKVTRQFMVYSSWLLPICPQVGTIVVMDLVYLIMADGVSAAGARWLAYVLVFWSSLGAFVYLIFTPVWLAHMRSIIGQAEAD